MYKVRKIKHEIVLFFILILGLVLRLKDLGKPTLWFDEVVSVYNAGKNIAAIIEAEVNLPPVYNIFLHFWIGFFGKSEFAVRFPSLLFGLGIVFFIYKLAGKLFSRKIGLLSAFIATIAPYQVYYSQETRMYSLVTLLCLLASYSFLKAIEDKKNKFWVLYIVFLTLSFYTHYYALSMSLFHGLFLLFFWKKEKKIFYKWGLAQFITVILFSFWVPVLFKSITSGGIAWASWLLKEFGPLTQLGFIFFVFTVGYSAVTYFPPQNLSEGIKIFANLPFSGYLVIMTFLTVFFISVGLFGLQDKKWKKNSLFIVFYLFTPVISAFIMFFILKQQLTATKYLIIASPPFYILLALGLTGTRNKAFKGILFLLLIGVMGCSLYNFYYSPKLGKGQWFKVADYIESNSEGDDLIVIHKPYLDIAFNYYYEGANKLYRLPISSSIDEEKFMDNFKSENKGYKRIWLIVAHNFETGPYYRELFNKYFIAMEEKIFPAGYMVGIYLFNVGVENTLQQ